MKNTIRRIFNLIVTSANFSHWRQTWHWICIVLESFSSLSEEVKTCMTNYWHVLPFFSMLLCNINVWIICYILSSFFICKSSKTSSSSIYNEPYSNIFFCGFRPIFLINHVTFFFLDACRHEEHIIIHFLENKLEHRKQFSLMFIFI